MHEGDLMAAGADSGDCIDEFDALGLPGVELSLNVFQLDGDVVDPGTLLLQKLGDGTLRGGRLQKLDTALATLEHGYPHSLFRHLLLCEEFEAETLCVKGFRLGKGRNRYPYVVDLFHDNTFLFLLSGDSPRAWLRLFGPPV